MIRSIEDQLKWAVMVIVLFLSISLAGTSLILGYREARKEQKAMLWQVIPLLETKSVAEVETFLHKTFPAWSLVSQEVLLRERDPAWLPFSQNRVFLLRSSLLWKTLLEKQRYVLLVATMGVLLSVELAVFLAYALSRPLKLLRWGCSEVREGRWSRIPQLSRIPLELVELYEVFNEMVDKLREAQELSRRIGRVERLAALGTLVASVAHEIRNPLASMRIHLDLLVRALKGEEKEKALILGEEIQRLNQTVLQLLEYASPREPLKRTFFVRDVLHWGYTMISSAAREKHVEVTFGADPPEATLWGDEDQIRQLLLNLLLNALEAQQEGGVLRMDATLREGTLFLKVEDRGGGVPEELRERIFDPFFTTKPEGTGLGLSIAHRIAEQHGGSMDCIDIPGGTSFVVTLPGKITENEDGSHHATLDCG
jgi:signal transduction histidine kinase